MSVSYVPPFYKAGQPSLKIVHIGDFFFSLKKRAPSQFSVGGKLSHGLIRNGHHVIDVSYRDIARAGSWWGSRKGGRRYLIRALKQFIAASAPDLLLLGHGYMIPPAAIEEIRHQQPGMLVAQWNIDALFVEDNARDFAARHHVVDASFISTAGPEVRQLVGKEGFVGFLPNPVDHTVERGRSFEIADLPYDLFYSCGNPARLRRICGRDWEMNAFCQALEQSLPETVSFAYAGVRGQPYLNGPTYCKILENSALGLNISRRADHFLYSSDRLAQMVGNGQLILMERQTGYDRLFSEKDMFFFESFEELADGIRYFHTHPETRQKIAQSGWQRYHELFNEQAVADYMVQSILGTLREEDYPWRHIAQHG